MGILNRKNTQEDENRILEEDTIEIEENTSPDESVDTQEDENRGNTVSIPGFRFGFILNRGGQSFKANSQGVLEISKDNEEALEVARLLSK